MQFVGDDSLYTKGNFRQNDQLQSDLTKDAH